MKSDDKIKYQKKNLAKKKASQIASCNSLQI